MPKNAPSGGDDPPPTNADLLDRLDTLENKLDALRRERDDDQLLTREEAAERLQISLRKLGTLTAAGEVQSLKIGRCVRYDPDALDAFVRRCAEGASR